jgi:hypothetical protein
MTLLSLQAWDWTSWLLLLTWLVGLEPQALTAALLTFLAVLPPCCCCWGHAQTPWQVLV